MPETQASFWINLSWIVGYLVAAGIIAVISGLIVSNRVAHVLQSQFENLAVRVGRLETDTSKHAEWINQEENERLRSEVRAAREFAGRGELSRLVADSTQQYRDLSDQIKNMGDTLHSRVTDLSEEFREFKGKVEEPR